MKSLNPRLQAHLDEGTTTLSPGAGGSCALTACGFGFTDRSTLAFEGTELDSENQLGGLTASEVRSGSTCSVDAQDAEGVLTSDRITETDILDGPLGQRSGRCLAGELARHRTSAC